MNIFSLFNPASYVIPRLCGEKEPDNLIWLWAIIWAIVVGYLSTLGHPWWTAGAGTFALWALASMRITKVSKMRDAHNRHSNERASIINFSSGWASIIKDRWTGNVLFWDPWTGRCSHIDRRTGVETEFWSQHRNDGWRAAFDHLCKEVWGDKDLRPAKIQVEVIQDTDETKISHIFDTGYQKDGMTHREYFPELFEFLDGKSGDIFVGVKFGYAIYRPSVVAVKVSSYIQEFKNEDPL